MFSSQGGFLAFQCHDVYLLALVVWSDWLWKALRTVYQDLDPLAYGIAIYWQLLGPGGLSGGNVHVELLCYLC
jgi:hypothetical protein